jgi:hypothetical protein
MEILMILCNLCQGKTNPILNRREALRLCLRRLPRPFGPRNDVHFSTALCLSAPSTKLRACFVANCAFEKTKPIVIVRRSAYRVLRIAKTNL